MSKSQVGRSDIDNLLLTWAPLTFHQHQQNDDDYDDDNDDHNKDHNDDEVVAVPETVVGDWVVGAVCYQTAE